MQTQEREPVLVVNDLSVQFSTYSGTVHAVRNVDLQLNKGETLAIVGESGSGKSVTTKAILGILPKNGRITSGEIFFEGKNMAVFKKEDYYAIRGEKSL